MSKFDELTAFEVSQAEQQVGLSVEVTRDEHAPKLAMYGALAWVHVKRTEPTLTYDQYMKRVKPREPMNYLFSGDDEDDVETEPGDDLDEGAGFRADSEPAGESSGDDEGAVLPEDGPGPE